MTAMSIDAAHVHWTIGGAPATAEQAITALATRPLLLLMHGFGSFEGDLIGLAPRLPHEFVCASPRALLVAPPPIVNGFAWWELPIGPDGMPKRVSDPSHFAGTGPHQAATSVLEWLDELDEQVAEASGGVGLGTIALLGFSQGGCMVTSMLRLRPERFAAGVNCSGFVAPGQHDDSALAAVSPPLFWGRDEHDPIISPDRIDFTAQWSPANTALEAHLYEGIAHGIGADEVDDIAAFLRRHVLGTPQTV
ncbi:MAG: phospholipase [Microbacteriaceae bacterium]|nr:phospholipase [Microbacteriaceae bacterium]